MTRVVYLDNNATTALDPRVLDVMLPALRNVGNASSAHPGGRWARAAVDDARAKVAALVGGRTQDVVFTSGATEANNLAILGATSEHDERRNHVVTCATEHPAVLEAVENLRSRGVPVSVVGVNNLGLIDLDELSRVISERTCLVTVMAANNETGVLAPIADIASIAHAAGALVHTDATQLMAWGAVSIDDLQVDMLSLSAHKFHGPQGVGALIVRRDTQRELHPVSYGGGHERGLRSGTLNAAGIVGAGAAAQLVYDEGSAAASPTRRRRDELAHAISERVGADHVVVNGHPLDRTPGTLNISLVGCEADALVAAVSLVAMSTGSACSTGVPGPSHVLTAMGLPPHIADSAIRLSLSRDTTDSDIEEAAAAIVAGAQLVLERMNLNTVGIS